MKFYINFYILLLIFLISCKTTVPIKYPKFPEGIEGSKLRQVLKNKKKIAVVVKELPNDIKNNLIKYQNYNEWQETVRAAMKTTLEEYGYYVVVDIESRSQRYNELARSQTGITKNQKALGQELNIDHLFYVNMTAAPRLECKTEIITNYRQVKKRIKTKDGIVEISEIVPTKEIQRILYLTIFLEATLVNIETGRSISSSSQEPYVLSGFVGNPDCPSELVAFNEAIKTAAKKIADRLSPRVEIISVPLEKKDPSISVGNKKLVNQLLEDGVKWLESGNVEEAIKSWQLALEESEGTSKSAYWNIAVAMWYQGELEQAQKYFDQAMKLGGSDFFDSSKRKFYTIFKQEKKRIEEEED